MIISKEITAIKDAILSVVPAEKLFLFGSYAKNEQKKNSDYDFYIVLPDNGLRQGEAIERAQTAIFSSTKYEIPVDVLAGYKKVFDRRKVLPTIERVVEREGVVLFEKQ